MFCTNCGHKLNDGDVFCSNCGVKVKKTELATAIPEAVAVTAQKNEIVNASNVPVKTVVHVKENNIPIKAEAEEVVPVNISVQQVPPVPPIPTVNIQSDNNAFIEKNYDEYVKERNTIIPLAVFSILFSLLTIAAAVIEIIDGSGNAADIARLIIISAASVMFIVYAVSNNKVVSIIKGGMLTVLLISDIIFVGFSSVKYAIETMGSDAVKLAKNFDVSEGIITAYLVTIIVWIVAMYIFFIIDMIRAFIGTRKLQIFTMIFGYVAVLGVIMQMVFMYIIQDGITLYFEFLPINMVYVFLIAADLFGVKAKRNIKKK